VRHHATPTICRYVTLTLSIRSGGLSSSLSGLTKADGD
jgi:hypothetical protein